MPIDAGAIGEDRIGANVDAAAEIAHADERGRTSDALRDELKPLE